MNETQIRQWAIEQAIRIHTGMPNPIAVLDTAKEIEAYVTGQEKPVASS